MTNEEKRQFMQCLFSAAWTDGSLAESENAILATLYNNVELPAEIRDEIDDWFDEPPPAPDWLAMADKPELRDTLFKQVFLVMASDGNVDMTETGLLQRLKDKLGIPDDRASAIVNEVESIVANQ